jgi:hypothetical protein
MDGWMDGRMGGWMDGWMDGWTNGWMDEWVDGWTDKLFSISLTFQFILYCVRHLFDKRFSLTHAVLLLIQMLIKNFINNIFD